MNPRPTHSHNPNLTHNDKSHTQHPDDKNEAYLPKILVLLGFTLSQACILLLPLDVANKDGYAGCSGYDTSVCGGLDMQGFWEGVYIAILVFVVFLIPFAIFYYEADDGMGNAGEVREAHKQACDALTSTPPRDRSRAAPALTPHNHQTLPLRPQSMLCNAIKYEVVVLIASTLTLVLMYFYLGETNIPVSVLTASVSESTTSTMAAGTWPTASSPPPFTALTTSDFANAAATLPPSDEHITMQVTFPVYASAMLSFVGWFFFCAFGGVGLASLPIDLICAFVYRPRHMDAFEFAEAQLSVRARVNELVEIGEMLKQERAGRAEKGQGYWQRRR